MKDILMYLFFKQSTPHNDLIDLKQSLGFTLRVFDMLKHNDDHLRYMVV